MSPTDSAREPIRNLRRLQREATTANDADQRREILPPDAYHASQHDSAAVRNLASTSPMGRIVYLDEPVMRQVALRLANDAECFKRLRVGAKSITPVTIETVPDAMAADPVFYAKVVWTLPPTETLLSFGMAEPSLDQLGVIEAYPQAIVRIRCWIRPTSNFTPERFTGVTSRGERVTILVGTDTGLSTNRSFLRRNTLFVVGTLRKVANPTVSAGAILI